SFLPFWADVALTTTVWFTLCFVLGGWSIYTIIKRDAYWEPIAIIGLWIAAVMLALPTYFFFWARHLERQRHAQSLDPDA
ncbi:MAG TPA: hypothetical protein VGS80_05090, partial [Ktedonobacterales bacterium]|nr:hypothetical protein [Ktedonobacterales bacterium]